MNYQTNLQTGISCISVLKLTLKQPLLFPTDMKPFEKPLEAYVLRLMTVIVATMPSEWENTDKINLCSHFMGAQQPISKLICG